jgi:vancomycin resistance protein VanW
LKKIKLKIRILNRLFKDLVSGIYFRFSNKDKSNSVFNFIYTISQEVKQSETFENKLYNIQAASTKINDYILYPGQVFSFWKIVGNPNGDFKFSRSIIDGKLSEEKGGGLCQVSGIIYHVSILFGLEIIERFNHSIDIYTDDSRFTPLGTDATVVYGYKDLRIRNNFDFSIKFKIDINDRILTIKLLSEQSLIQKQLKFEINETDKLKVVFVVDENLRKVNESIYKIG